MKRGTPDHPKTLELTDAIKAYLDGRGVSLSIVTCQTLAVGYLEQLFHSAGRYFADGNIGKYSDSRIATMIGWEWEPSAIIEILTRASCRFIDTDIEGIRLYVHDWHEHSDENADRYLRTHNMQYANGLEPRTQAKKESVKKQSRTKRDSVATNPRSGHASQSHSQSHSQSQKSESKPEGDARNSGSVETGSFQEISDALLRDTTGLLRWWFAAYANKLQGVLAYSDQNKLRTVAMAEHCLRVGDNPAAMFVHNVQGGLWQNITLVDEDAATERIRVHESRGRSPPSRTSSGPRPIGEVLAGGIKS